MLSFICTRLAVYEIDAIHGKAGELLDAPESS